MFKRQVKRLCSAASSNQAINFVNPGGNLTLSHRKRAIPCPIEFYHNRGVFLETGKVDMKISTMATCSSCIKLHLQQFL